jgi:hypothetical protein
VYWLMNFRSLPGHQAWLDPKGPKKDRIVCAVNPDHLRTTRTWDSAAYADPESPEKPLKSADAYYAANNAVFLLHLRVLQGMADAGLTGWEAYPATIRRKSGVMLSEFSELRVTGFSGIASEAAGCVLRSRCPGCGLNTYESGFRFDLAVKEAAPNGPDFTAIWPLYRRILCSSRARSLLETFDTQEIEFVDPATMDTPLPSVGDTPVPPYFTPDARSSVERFWASAPSVAV